MFCISNSIVYLLELGLIPLATHIRLVIINPFILMLDHAWLGLTINKLKKLKDELLRANFSANQTCLRIVGSYCSKLAQQKKLTIEARDSTVEENHHSTYNGEWTTFLVQPRHCCSQMSLVVRKPVFGVSDQVRHKLGSTATQDG